LRRQALDIYLEQVAVARITTQETNRQWNLDTKNRNTLIPGDWHGFRSSNSVNPNTLIFAETLPHEIILDRSGTQRSEALRTSNTGKEQVTAQLKKAVEDIAKELTMKTKEWDSKRYALLQRGRQGHWSRATPTQKAIEASAEAAKPQPETTITNDELKQALTEIGTAKLQYSLKRLYNQHHAHRWFPPQSDARK